MDSGRAIGGHALRLTLDTNILAYAEGVNGSSMKQVALDLVQKLPQDTTFLPVQVLGELFNLLVSRAGRTRARARAAILSWRDAFPLVETCLQLCSARRISQPITNSLFGMLSFFRPPLRSDAGCFFPKTCSRVLLGVG